MATAVVGRPWVRGQSGNPRGRENSGLTLAEWIDALGAHKANGSARYSPKQLEEIVDAPGTAPPKRAAARLWLAAVAEGISKNGRPMCLEAIREILDRRIGKPTEHIQIEQRTLSVVEIRATVAGLLADPALHAELEHEPGLALAILGGLLARPAVRAAAVAAGMLPEAPRAPPAALPPT